MQDLTIRTDKIKEKRKQTPRRNYIKELASRYSLTFYKNHGLVSRFPTTGREGPIVKYDTYIKEYGDGTTGSEYDDTKSFFKNIEELFQKTPKMSQIQYFENENCEYAETVFGAKNGYLSVCIGDNADVVVYSTMAYSNVKNIFNSVLATSNSENIYSSKVVTDSFNIFYSRYIHNSNNIWFSDNLLGCSECIFCSNLENQSYHINNQKLEKEKYLEEKEKLLKEKYNFDTYQKKLNNIAQNKLAPNCTGNAIQFCENIENGNMISRFKDGRNISFADGTPISTKIYDCFDVGTCDDLYGWMGCGQGCDNMYCGTNATGCHNIYYSYFLENCSYCLGCIGLKNKSFCILNKQYTKEERFEKANEIFAQMDRDGTLGQFFPGSMNPFYFNDTAAYLIDDTFTKEEVTKEGYLRRDEEIKVDVPEGTEVITTSDLDQYQGRIDNGTFIPQSEIRNLQLSNQGIKGEWHINKEILKKVIKDEKGNYYRIIPIELEFLQKHGLPLPEIHWLERIKLGFKCK